MTGLNVQWTAEAEDWTHSSYLAFKVAIGVGPILFPAPSCQLCGCVVVLQPVLVICVCDAR